MIDPIPRIRYPIQRRRLNINILIRRIEIHVSDCGSLVSGGTRDGHTFEVWGDDEVDVLAGVGEETDHGESDE